MKRIIAIMFNAKPLIRKIKPFSLSLENFSSWPSSFKFLPDIMNMPPIISKAIPSKAQ